MQRTRNATPIDAAEIHLPDPGPTATQVVCAAEERTQLAKCLERLSPRQQEVLRLRLDAGLSYREIAEVTGLTISNVGFHLHEAIRNLRHLVAT